ncbi:MAG TPA: DUF4861 domain-containing protein [Prevotella sp.]|nr:DUF4861 domain-containing protein [Prevotella sp.]
MRLVYRISKKSNWSFLAFGILDNSMDESIASVSSWTAPIPRLITSSSAWTSRRISLTARMKKIDEVRSSNINGMARRLFPLLLLLLSSVVAEANNQWVMTVENTTGVDQTDYPVTIDLKGHGTVLSAKVTDLHSRQALPYQIDDLDRDGINDELFFLAKMKAGEKSSFQIELYSTYQKNETPARTYAEIVQRTKGRPDIYLSEFGLQKGTPDGTAYNLLHHHGVAVENELIAFRIYFDQRQTLDLYGKNHKGLELRDTQFYPTAAQKAAGYGDDILWVGRTFGFGALRGWNGNNPTMVSDVGTRVQRIIASGPLRAIVEVEDREWRTDSLHAPVNLTIRYTVIAGHRDVAVDARFNRPTPELRFATGLINVRNSMEFSDHKGLRGLWGSDYPSEDTLKCKKETLGMGIYIPQKYVVRELKADKDNYGFVIRAVDNRICYYLTYSSDNEDYGYHSARKWFVYLREWAKVALH